jgi:hypothetical protein
VALHAAWSADAALLHASKAAKQASAFAFASSELACASLSACDASDVVESVAPLELHAVAAVIATRPATERIRNMEGSYLR